MTLTYRAPGSRMSGRRSDPSGFNASVINEFRANGGIVGGELSDMRLLLLTTIDERSRTPRTTPLAYHRRGSRYLVIASNGGAPRNPAWFRNLERDRGVTVEVGLETFAATATILDASERDAAFATIVAEAPSAASIRSEGRPNDSRDRAGTTRLTSHDSRLLHHPTVW